MKDKEHIRSIRNNKDTTGYTHHILNTGHSYGPIDDTMEIVTILKKGKHSNTMEKYHIFCVKKCDRHLNNIHINNQNPIFNSICSHYNEHLYPLSHPTLPLYPLPLPHYQ
jgi:hypothetical protein